MEFFVPQNENAMSGLCSDEISWYNHPMDNTVELHRRVSAFLRREASWAGHRIVCAVSGGPDSVALLRILLDTAPELGAIVCGACHFEHGIRGAASVKDMEFVQGLCETWNVPLYCERGNVPASASGGFETAAREERRAFYGRAMESLGADVCALGHHLNDQAETALMQLLRGTRAAVGMRAFDGKLLRPLLCVSRDELLGYLEARGISYRHDETNDIPDNPRNLLRLRAMPAMLEAYPRGLSALCRATRYAREDDTYLCGLASDWLKDCRKESGLVYSQLPPPPILRRAMAMYAASLGAKELNETLLDRLLSLAEATNGTRLDCVGILLERSAQGIVVVREDKRPRSVPLNIPGETVHPDTGWVFTAQYVRDVVDFGRPTSLTQHFDADLLPKLCVRTREEGDRMHAFGAPGGKRLKDILIDKKLPRALREQVPLVASGKEIWWAVGVARGAGAAVTEKTTRVLRVDFMKIDHSREQAEQQKG